MRTYDMEIPWFWQDRLWEIRRCGAGYHHFDISFLDGSALLNFHVEGSTIKDIPQGYDLSRKMIVSIEPSISKVSIGNHKEGAWDWI